MMPSPGDSRVMVSDTHPEMLPTRSSDRPPSRWLAILSLLACVALPRTASAGAWAQEDKSTYVKLSVARSLATQQYKEDGDTFQLLSEDEDGRYDSWGTFLYAEFGLLPRLTAMVSTQFASSTIESDLVRIRTTGIGDFRFGLKYQFLDDPIVMSASGWLTAPTGYTPDPPQVKAPTLGLGVFAGTANLLIGKSFYPAPFYVSGSVGFRYRGQRTSRGGDTVDYPPEVPYRLEAAWGPADWVWIRALLNGVWGLGDPQELNTFSLSSLTQSYTKVGPSAIFTIADHYQINLDYLYTVAGINSVRSHDISLGFALDF